MNNPPANAVEELFLELLDLPEEARAERLRERCGDDEQLKARVLKLLAADAENASDDAFAGPAADIGVAIPLRVGNYTVRAVVGEGGMGAVYDALHEPTGRRAAVKLIRAGLATGRERERFRIEAETLARLNDPGIAQLYDAGLAEVVWSGGAEGRRPFIAMEFVEDAATCVEFARKRDLPARECAKLIERVARAVQHAHQRGVIHCDLKPGNVLVMPDGQPKVVDFGIARLLDATAADGITITGQILGTVRYMSPEQAGGDPRQVDTRADIYSLGAILFEMLAKRPLIDVPSGASFGAAVQMLNASPPRLTSIRPELAGDLDAIVSKSIERDANDRYGSALALAEDLARFLDGREVSARAPSTVERFVRIVKRNKAKFVAAALVALSLVGGIVGTSVGLIHAERSRRAEVDQRKKAEFAQADSRAYGEFLTGRILAAARPKDMQGGLGIDVTVVEAMKAAEQHIGHDFANQPGAEAMARHSVAITWRQRGDLHGAEQQLRLAIQLAERAYGAGNEVTLNMRNSLQVLLQQMQKSTGAIAAQEQILRDMEQTAGPHDVRTITARYNLAIYSAQAGDYDRALPLLEQVQADRASAYGADSVLALSTVSDIAEVHQLMGHHELALLLQEELIEKFSLVLGDDNPQTLNARYRLACLHQHIGHTEVAADMHERVIPGLRRALGDQNVTTLDAIVQLAQCRLKLKEYDRAVPLYREYAAGQGKLLGERSPQMAQELGKTTTALMRHNQFKSAEEFARRLLTLRQELSPDAPPLFEAQCMLGECLAAQNQRDEAMNLLTAGVEGLDRQATLSSAQEARRQSAGKALIGLLEVGGDRDSAGSWRTRLATSRPTTKPG